MDYFKNLSDDDLTLAHSPLLRAAQLTLQYTQGNGSIELTKSPAKLFVELIPFYLFQIDHGAYSRVKAYPEGNWDVWLNVLNVEVENGAKEAALYKVFYSEPNKGPMSWRKTGPFYSCVLRPLSWAGLLSQPEMQNKPSSEKDYFKTPLWRSALKPETDRLVQPAQRH